MDFFHIFNKKSKQDNANEEIYELLNKFTEISLKIPMQRRKNLFRDANTYPIVFSYFFGAMDYIRQYKNIDNIKTERIFITYLSMNFTKGDVDNATNLNIFVTDLSQTDEGMNYIKVGRKAFKTWVNNKAESSSELNRLLVEAVND